ncbi:helix-turn-helix domain-containing protein [Paenibacillus spongiae]|uniref:Helix-turn-helix domain-containing protein n=1 Tax=Paenibacillus spongiae TaxID=2909671 RepID=A0ABY5S6U7_9BACL|nr:helix-turn-helix domain-containing protein [Paenibacillus spongiae]UVI29627.1 helix-turn-helix domain-containing protein [Paenibacillus spongiae]
MKIRVCGSGTLVRSDDLWAGGVHAANYEMLYIVSGKARFNWNGRVCIAEAPAMFLMPPLTPHQLQSISPEIKFRFLEITDIDESPLDREKMDKWNELQAHNDIFSRTVLAAALLESFDWIYRLHLTGEARQHPDLEQVCLLEVSKIYRLIAYCLDSTPLPAGNPDQSPGRDVEQTVDQLVDFMEWRYKEEITLAALADLVHLNPSYLIRMFKKQKKVTPFEFLRDLRLKAAVSLLSGSTMPVQEIAHETGFGSVHYFCRLFKQTYGQSPAEWRKQLRRG